MRQRSRYASQTARVRSPCLRAQARFGIAGSALAVYDDANGPSTPINLSEEGRTSPIPYQLPPQPSLLTFRLLLPSSLHYIASLLIHFRLPLPAAFLDFLSPSSCARHLTSHRRRTFASRQNKKLRNIDLPRLATSHTELFPSLAIPPTRRQAAVRCRSSLSSASAPQ